MTGAHIPVLLKETMDLLSLEAGDVYLDATLGEGGHAEEVARRMDGHVVICGIDVDPMAVEIAKLRFTSQDSSLQAEPKFGVLNFRHIQAAPALLGIKNPSKILFDLGWNKRQFEEGERGFSFQKDEPLIMTLGPTSEKGFTAETIVNSWDQENIKIIIESYGEEKFADRIAERIVEEREKSPIKTSLQLSEIVKRAVPVWYRFRKIHPATKTFQALRIAVNDELQALEEGLKGAYEILEDKGRLAVISFHSLEDRIVKKFFKDLSLRGGVEILTKRPLIASEEEITLNPRSRSAKLRGIKKTHVATK